MLAISYSIIAPTACNGLCLEKSRLEPFPTRKKWRIGTVSVNLNYICPIWQYYVNIATSGTTTYDTKIQQMVLSYM